MKCAYHNKCCDKWHRGGANHPHYSVISTPTMSFITPFDMDAHFIFYSDGRNVKSGMQIVLVLTLVVLCHGINSDIMQIVHVTCIDAMPYV